LQSGGGTPNQTNAVDTISCPAASGKEGDDVSYCSLSSRGYEK